MRAWYCEASKAEWRTSADMKQTYGSASIINAERVVFNICGNRHGQVVRINFRMEHQGLKAADLIPYLGGKSRVSEMLSGRRTLNRKEMNNFKVFSDLIGNRTVRAMLLQHNGLTDRKSSVNPLDRRCNKG